MSDWTLKKPNKVFSRGDKAKFAKAAFNPKIYGDGPFEVLESWINVGGVNSEGDEGHWWGHETVTLETKKGIIDFDVAWLVKVT